MNGAKWGSLCRGCDHLQALHHLHGPWDGDAYVCSVDECDCVMHRGDPTLPIGEVEWRRTARPHEKRALRKLQMRKP